MDHKKNFRRIVNKVILNIRRNKLEQRLFEQTQHHHINSLFQQLTGVGSALEAFASNLTRLTQDCTHLSKRVDRLFKVHQEKEERDKELRTKIESLLDFHKSSTNSLDLITSIRNILDEKKGEQNDLEHALTPAIENDEELQAESSTSALKKRRAKTLTHSSEKQTKNYGGLRVFRINPIPSQGEELFNFQNQQKIRSDHSIHGMPIDEENSLDSNFSVNEAQNPKQSIFEKPIFAKLHVSRFASSSPMIHTRARDTSDRFISPMRLQIEPKSRPFVQKNSTPLSEGQPQEEKGDSEHRAIAQDSLHSSKSGVLKVNEQFLPQKHKPSFKTIMMHPSNTVSNQPISQMKAEIFRESGESGFLQRTVKEKPVRPQFNLKEDAQDKNKNKFLRRVKLFNLIHSSNKASPRNELEFEVKTQKKPFDRSRNHEYRHVHGSDDDMNSSSNILPSLESAVKLNEEPSIDFDGL